MNAVDPRLHRGERRAEPVCPRAIEMAETIREIVFRDGCVTEQAMVYAGYSIAEIVEHYPAAEARARSLLVADGRIGDRVPEIIEKAVAAQAWFMPLTTATPETETMRIAWRAYCTAIAAHKLDPWISQTERCLVKLDVFLGTQALIKAEINRIITAVAAVLRKRT